MRSRKSAGRRYEDLGDLGYISACLGSVLRANGMGIFREKLGVRGVYGEMTARVYLTVERCVRIVDLTLGTKMT